LEEAEESDEAFYELGGKEYVRTVGIHEGGDGENGVRGSRMETQELMEIGKTRSIAVSFVAISIVSPTPPLTRFEQRLFRCYIPSLSISLPT